MNLILRGQLQFLQQHYDVTGITADDGFHFERIAPREGIQMRIVPFKRDISLWRDVYCLLLLIGAMLKAKPKLVHTQTPKAGLLGMLAAWICRVPVRIHSVTGVPLGQMEGGIRGRILRTMELVTFKCATHIVPNSKGVHALLLNHTYLAKSGKMEFLGHGSTNGVQLDRFVFDSTVRNEMREKWGIQPDEFVLGYVGRLARDKGSVELLEAYKNLKQKYPQLRLLSVGLFDKDYGMLGEAFEKDIQETPGVILAGRQPEVVPFFQMMDMLVHPSYREGLPNVLLEAAAMGLPVVSTLVNGCMEVVEDGVTGDLVPAKDAKALENAIESLFLDTNRREKMKLATRNRVAAYFDQKVVWENWKKYYDQTLASVR